MSASPVGISPSKTPVTASLVKSPLNYTGGKFRLLPQILPLLPDDIDTFVDAFGGGGTVMANVPANRSVYNDVDTQVAGLLAWMATTDSNRALSQVQDVIDHFGLNRDNRDGYFAARAAFNDNGPWRTPATLYALVAHGFNNQTRFNSKGDFNIPFGKREFNDKLRTRFVEFTDRLDALNLDVCSGSFTDLDIDDGSFVYCDPPYLITMATYNTAGAGWGPDQESTLEDWLVELDGRGIRWALSNVTEHQGRTNDRLIKFARNFFVTDLDISYASASYHKKDRTSRSREVLVTNFSPSKGPSANSVLSALPHLKG